MTAVAMAEMRERLRSAAVSACAPGRLCLAGESLDWMTGGPSVVAAVPLHTEVSVTRGDGGPVVLHSPDTEPATRVVHLPELGAYAGDGLDYMQATAKVVTGSWPLLMGGATIEARSSVPVGAGLSSSAALTVATAAALMRFAVGVIPPAPSVAWAAYHAEAGELGTGAGWMDFLACTHGGVCRIDAGEQPRVTRLSGSLGAPLVLIDTIQRRTTRAVLASKRDRYRSGDPAMRAYAEAATGIVGEMTAELRSAAPDAARVGGLLNQGQALLRELVHCSTDLIDECVTRCLAAGAYGAKLTGSGHGGCLFALAPLDAIGPVLAMLRDLPVRVMVFTTSEAHGVVFPPSEF
ncbi:mevalonate kinase family protein [Dactylosporangium sp. CA-092794]|uniref:mevalonate kinase family protein n=1 Tax=Dactylosporangium sp. CA-092794 TaxID=3239929 RepID=UPI003D9229CC